MGVSTAVGPEQVVRSFRAALYLGNLTFKIGETLL